MRSKSSTENCYQTSELLQPSFGDTLGASSNILQKMQFSFKLHRVLQKSARVIIF